MSSTPTLPPLHRIAADAYTARQRKAQGLHRNGGISATAATDALRPWLAIACLAGADLPELEEGIASHCTYQRIWGAEPRTVGEDEARALLADELCPAAERRATLATARDRAVNALYGQSPEPAEAQATARALIALADWLGCRPWLPPALAFAAPAQEAA